MPDLEEKDLAPGDRKSMERDWSALELHSITDIKTSQFQLAYRYLWEEFGRKHEIEQVEVLKRRLIWSPRERVDSYAMRYEMLLITAHGTFAAARDHTVIVDYSCAPPCVIVHLSHVLVHPIWRRTGLAGRLRALPVQAVRRVLKDLDLPETTSITLVAEMEPPLDGSPERLIRLLAYEKAGFQKADPSVVPYLQPDFRPFDEIEGSGGAELLPFWLILRRVGREEETEISCQELKQTIRALYTMYAREFRLEDMKPVWASLNAYPPDDFAIPLLPPIGG
jgi:hypothetical protein